MTKLTLALLLAAVPAALAACPNACSKHGECKDNDSCDCHAGFQGGDCSERVCLYNWAWVTTANGDLNFDGDRYDGTVYSTTISLDAAMDDLSVGVGGATLRTQANPGGTWESWPYHATAQEGHFYMECSNRGLCDRATGDCVCFDGYTGTACNRMRCPEDCNGRGTCLTVKDFDATYALWDRDMARSCKCDAGWTGPACQTRLCPYGNDVLTKDNEIVEVQYVDIFSKCEGTDGTPTGCRTLADGSAQLGGYARLSYVDHYGETYETAPFAVTTMDGTTNALAVATDAQAALRALPNDVVANTVTVTAQYCETGVYASETITAAGARATTTDPAFRLLSGTAAESSAVLNGAGTVLAAGTSTWTVAAAATLTEGSFQLAELTNPMCIRLRVAFNGMPGNLNDLVVNHADVTYFGETNTQDNSDNNNAHVSSAVTSDLTLVTGATAGYTKPSSVTVTDADAQIDIAAKTITLGTAIYDAVTNTFHPASRIKVECRYSLDSVNTYRNLGIYTVSTTTLPTTTVIAVDESIVANECTAATSNVRITSVSNVLTLGDFDFSNLQEGTGITVSLGTDGFQSTVKPTVGVQYHSAWTIGAAGYLILAEEETNTASSVTEATLDVVVDGDGTMENVECGDRGICQEDGTCKCFAGYTGDACSIQKAISA